MIQNSHYNLHLWIVSIVREDEGSCLILIGVLFGGFKFELIWLVYWKGSKGYGIKNLK